MKKQIFYIIFCSLIFIGCFLYLNQKVKIYIESYNLTKKYRTYNECIDKYDYLLYNLMQETRLDKLNEWVEQNQFQFAKKEKILVLRTKGAAGTSSTAKAKDTKVAQKDRLTSGVVFAGE